MDETDYRILDLMKGNARMSYKELADAIGMSRVAAMKRVKKLEKAGIIRGYNTYIKRPDEITVFIDIVIKPDRFDAVLEYVSTRTAFIRQIFTTTKENAIHIVAVSDSIRDLKYLAKMINKKCGDDVFEIQCHAVKEIIKDVYGGIRYEHRKPGNDT
ncbi:MAG: winged helix-turn-helix transcriptional regulator [Lachnospiraceae bacterium]|nr:winged helix-turn-helix transcriptional regulator [Lachnospiraceae bacterium]